ncbi:hypothetical protein Nepgr_008308 [Nepenthes gracilis]|uniref:Calcium uniporter protein C-terminal domain-containing protein n=1 Tax=Nepenthes gracilis TaxID=150966 RepID=A0AAD3S8I2_NEPGR|nr:hypothetical protein Nepgr_008308 [Nepenthes gracilis]
MAFKKAMVHRLFNISGFSHPASSRNPLKPPLTQCLITSDPAKRTAAPKLAGSSGLFRRIMQRRPLYQSAISPGIRSVPTGDNLMEKLREMDIARERLRLIGLSPSTAPSKESEPSSPESNGFTVGDLKKLLRASQMEMVKAKLRQIPRDWISYSEYLQICQESCSTRKEEGLVYAKMLDESGVVIVLGNAVCLHPEQVAKAIRDLIPLAPLNPNDPRRKELEGMEKKKAVIDRKAESLVRKELWCGFGFLVVQTAVFMRLTFWELTWDVMEPICFYVTSMYFMVGYAFFLRTSKEPSFEGFFQSRFSAKQKQLFQTYNFDVRRYNELRQACCPRSPPLLEEAAAAFAPSFVGSERMKFGTASH